MAHAASQLKKKADENLNAVEDEKEKKRAKRRTREVKKKVEEGLAGGRRGGGAADMGGAKRGGFCHGAARTHTRTDTVLALLIAFLASQLREAVEAAVMLS